MRRLKIREQIIQEHTKCYLTRHSRLLQASERCFRKTLHQLLPLNNHYGNKEMPFSEAYICFFINPIYSILIPCLFKFRSGYANYSDYFFANQEYVFSVLVGGDYFLPHLTEASIWVKNIILIEKKNAYDQFQDCHGHNFLLFLTEKWQSSIFFILCLNNSTQEDDYWYANSY